MTDTAALRWWETRAYAALLVALAAVPLLVPEIPPLTDLPGHIGRYGVQLHLATSPYLADYYGFRWALLGNLGLDLVVQALGPLLGIEPVVKAVVLATPPLAVAGLLWSAREAHGRLPATAAFALPAVYGYPFQFGFVNYCLSMALAFCAFGLWLRLGRTRRIGWRAGLFLLLAPLLWVCHIFGWAVLCLLAAAAETIRWRATGRGWLRALWHGGLSCLPLALPLVLMAVWRSGDVAGQTTDWFNWGGKYLWLLAALRDRWMAWDIASVALMWLLAVAGVGRLGVRYEPRLGFAALLAAVAYLLLPRILLGSAYADMRLAPYALGLLVLALAPTSADPRRLGLIAALGLAFWGARIAGTTANYLALDRGFRGQLAAIDAIPRGARVLALVDLPCQGRWHYSRMDHIGSIAIERRDAFVNGQWSMAGAQLLTIRHFGAGRFAGDPTQLLRPKGCRRRGEPDLDDVLRYFPRAAFDYLWMIDRPVSSPIVAGELDEVWRGARRGLLYRVVRGSAISASDTPTGTRSPATQ